MKAVVPATLILAVRVIEPFASPPVCQRRQRLRLGVRLAARSSPSRCCAGRPGPWPPWLADRRARRLPRPPAPGWPRNIWRQPSTVTIRHSMCTRTWARAATISSIARCPAAASRSTTPTRARSTAAPPRSAIPFPRQRRPIGAAGSSRTACCCPAKRSPPTMGAQFRTRATTWLARRASPSGRAARSAASGSSSLLSARTAGRMATRRRRPRSPAILALMSRYRTPGSSTPSR